MAITWPAKNNYATGDVLTATNMNGVGDDLNDLFNNNFYAGKNKIINGDMFINQRNFTSTTAGSGYGLDRWSYIAVGGTCTYSAQTFTTGAAPVAGYEARNFAQIITASQSAAGDLCAFQQPIEDVRTLAGQTAVVSFWAKAASGTPKVGIELTQFFGSGGSPSADVNTALGSVTLSTSWARYSISVTVPSISGKTVGTNANSSALILNLWVSAGSSFASRASSIGIQNNTFQFWGVQVESGSTATPFQTATGTKQGELAACQRYLPAFSGSSLGGNLANVLGWAYSTTNAQFNIMLPVTPRVRPTGLTYSALSDFSIANQSFATAAPTAIAFNSGGQMCQINVTTTAGSPTLVLGQPVNLALSGANGLLLFTGCEL